MLGSPFYIRFAHLFISCLSIFQHSRQKGKIGSGAAGRQTAHEVRTQNSDIYYSFVGQITWPKWIDPNGLTQMDLPYDRPMGP